MSHRNGEPIPLPTNPPESLGPDHGSGASQRDAARAETRREAQSVSPQTARNNLRTKEGQRQTIPLHNCGNVAPKLIP